MYQQILERKKIQLFGNTDITQLFKQNIVEGIEPFQIEKFTSFLGDNKKLNDQIKYIFQRFRKFNYYLEKKDNANLAQKISKEYKILNGIFVELELLRFQQNTEKQEKIQRLFTLLKRFDTFNIQGHLIIIKNKIKHQTQNIIFNKLAFIRSDIKNIARKYTNNQTKFFYNTINIAQSDHNDKIQRKRRLYGQNSLQITRSQKDQSQRIINNWMRKQQCNIFRRNTHMKFNKLKGSYYTSKMIENFCTVKKSQNNTMFKHQILS